MRTVIHRLALALVFCLFAAASPASAQWDARPAPGRDGTTVAGTGPKFGTAYTKLPTDARITGGGYFLTVSGTPNNTQTGTTAVKGRGTSIVFAGGLWAVPAMPPGTVVVITYEVVFADKKISTSKYTYTVK